MRVKLDENLGKRTQNLFIKAGYNTETVREEGLGGIGDRKLYSICVAEKRCLITLDLDFANTLRFPPEKSYGIVVLRVPRNPSLKLLESLVKQIVENLKTTSVVHQLWIVEIGKIRIHQSN